MNHHVLIYTILLLSYTPSSVLLVVLILACFLPIEGAKEKADTNTKFNKNSEFSSSISCTLYSYSYWWCSVSNQFIHTRPDKGNREIQIARTRTEEEEEDEVEVEVKEDELGKSSIQSNQFT